MLTQILRNILITFFLIYTSIAFGETKLSPKRYVVQINNIPMYDNSAKIILNILDEHTYVYDISGKKIPLSKKLEIKKDMNLIVDDNLVTTISTLYNHCLEENRGNEEITTLIDGPNMKCAQITEINNVEIEMCVNKKNKMVESLSIWD